MQVKNCCSGRDLVEMFGSASAWLERNAAHINSLNVYPVPDGDTGINMLLTMRSAVAEASRANDDSASEVVRAIAHGALMGARGNSGVILSQILRGLATPLEGKELLDGGDLAAGLAAGSELAYKAVSHPVEGTILTVIREASTAARGVCGTNDLCTILEVTAAAAKETVARTPSMLAVLREAGVVDAGGLGLYVIFEGFLRYLRGDVDEYEAGETISAAHLEVSPDGEEHCYGYCTEFMIEGQGLNPGDIREYLETIGQSVLVVADDDFLRAHVHTPDPDAALGYASSLGKLHQVKVQNMDEQHEDFITMKRPPKIGIATVAVASGQGMEEVFRSLGVSAVVAGGPTMNPSTEELLRAVRAVASERVIILPNDPNIVLTAKQVCGLSDKEVAIVPTRTIPQGVAAILALGSEGSLEENVAAMEQAAAAVRTVEITTAVRSSKVGGLVMEKGQAIALLDGGLLAAGDNIPQLVVDVLSGIDLSRSEIITVYYGADTDSAEAGELAESLRHQYPHLEVEPIFGGQPHYNYIISVE
jgi:DAK2 domain fusion protein YloV